MAVGVVAHGVEDDNLMDDEYTDGDQAERANLGEDLLQVTGSVIVLAGDRDSTTEEIICTGGGDDGRTRKAVSGCASC